MTWLKNLREFFTGTREPMGLCMIISEQEGAEIWIEGKKTNYLTPKAVALPKNKEVEIMIKQVGHETHVARVFTRHNLSYHYCNLKRIPLKVIHNDEYHVASL